MIKLDSILGGIICFILSFLAKFRKYVSNNNFGKEDILIIKFWGVGSISLTFPLLFAIKNNIRSKITFLTFESNRELLDHIDEVDNVVTVRNNNIFKFGIDSIKVLLFFAKNRPSITFDMEFFSRYTAIISFLIGSKKRCGYKSLSKFQNSLYTDLNLFDPSKHISFNFYKMLSNIGVNLEEDYLQRFYKKRIDFKELDEENILKKNSLSEKYIVINPNSSNLCYNRRWLPEYFVSLLNKIRKQYRDIQFVFVGSKNERKYSEHIIDLLDNHNVINITGETSLSDLLIIIKRAQLLITNDSGPMHLASLFQIKCISFFGPETPALYGPLNKQNINFYDNELKCSPCVDVYNYKYCNCNNNLCMSRILPDSVFHSVDKILSGL